MRHEKIIKRADGSKVRINIEFRADWSSSKAEWSFRVDYCEKGKRTWIPSCDRNDYQFRRLSMEQRSQAIREKSLSRASLQEIEAAMLELWETLRPSM
jgi:hypothetical protein